MVMIWLFTSMHYQELLAASNIGTRTPGLNINPLNSFAGSDQHRE